VQRLGIGTAGVGQQGHAGQLGDQRGGPVGELAGRHEAQVATAQAERRDGRAGEVHGPVPGPHGERRGGRIIDARHVGDVVGGEQGSQFVGAHGSHSRESAG
jgi:hypothetical protein